VVRKPGARPRYASLPLVPKLRFENTLSPKLQRARPKLALGEIKVKVGGIGEGNELIKALMAIGKAVAEACEEGKKVAQNLAETAGKVAEDFSREAGKGVTNVSKEVSVAARNTDRAVSKAGKDTERALGKAGTQSAAAFTKATDDVAKNIQKARSWVDDHAPHPVITIPGLGKIKL
jgi:hypothetical protein